MNFIIGVIISFFVGFTLGKFGHKKKFVKENEQTKEQQEKLEKTQKAFDELMSYDYNYALGGGKDE